jgi:hypothetical protein
MARGLVGELTDQEKEEQTGMMLVTLAGKVAARLRRHPDERVLLWDGITDGMAGRFDTGKGTYDQKRARMIKVFVARHPELKGKLDARKPAK